MRVEKIATGEVSTYLYILKSQIKATIKLPEQAIDYYAGQWTEERILSSMASWLFLMSKDDGVANGVLLGTPVEGGVGTIIWVLVDQQVQKKGIGSQLFEASCREYKAMHAHKVKLTVPEIKTVEFYKKQGMILEGVHEKHWWGADFWSMGKLL